MLAVIYGLVLLVLCKATGYFAHKELEERFAWVDEEEWGS